MKICIATPDFSGPIRNGGVGTAFLGLVEALGAHHDIDVTVLYTSDYYQDGTALSWVEQYARSGIRFVPLPAAPATVNFQNIGRAQDYVVRSYRVYEYLKGADFDIVHFPDYLGIGYFSVMARKLGVGLARTKIITTAHGPVAWSRRYSYNIPPDLAAVTSVTLERYVVENCDYLVSPSRFLLDWLRVNGWHLPSDTRHLFNALPAGPGIEFAGDGGSGHVFIPNEIVFFGRLEQRKGLYLFVDAIQSLQATDPHLLASLTITFLGSFNEASLSRDLFARRMHGVEFRWRVIDDMSASQAQAYLLDGMRLAVIPSLMDNSPCTIAECLTLGIRFVTTDVGGNAELIRDATNVVSPNAGSLVSKLREILDDGLGAAAPVEELSRAGDALVAFHRQVFEAGDAHQLAAAPASVPPVSVCLVHRDRSAYLAEAMAGFANQTYPNFEVVLVDNGSTGEDTRRYLDELEASTHPFRLEIIRSQTNLFPAGARNLAASRARGEILKFHDDDNVSKPWEIEVFVRAIQRGAELVTCSLDFFEDGDVLVPERVPVKVLLFIGDGGGLSYLYNVMGDSNFAVRRDVFERLGGFDDLGFLYHAEDWRVLSKAKAAGVKIETIVEPLIWYRAESTRYLTNWRKRDIAGARFRAVNALTSGLPEEVLHLLLYLSGLHHAPPKEVDETLPP